MEPLDDRELKELLDRWEAPVAPASLSHRVLSARMPWWRWLFTGTIRIPVPVGVAAILLLAFWVYSATRPVAPAEKPAAAESTSLADFQPIMELESPPAEVGR